MFVRLASFADVVLRQVVVEVEVVVVGVLSLVALIVVVVCKVDVLVQRKQLLQAVAVGTLRVDSSELRFVFGSGRRNDVVVVVLVVVVLKAGVVFGQGVDVAGWVDRTPVCRRLDGLHQEQVVFV